MLHKRITITGGKGFLGTHLIRKMKENGYREIAVADLPEYNLVLIEDIRRLYDTTKPDVVIHLAAKVGGIGFNQKNPAPLFYENAMMGIQLLHEGFVRRIDKFVALGTICAYPKFTPVPFREDNIWNGYPEETNAPYGLAKKMMLVQSQAYRQQYGFNSIFLLPVNLYGPGDNFSFESSHVIPALIRKFYLAGLLARNDFDAIINDFVFNKETDFVIGQKTFKVSNDCAEEDLRLLLDHFGVCRVTGHRDSSKVANRPSEAVTPCPSSLDVQVGIWGTGQATREFFYVEDAAEAILLATEKYDKSEAVNIGAGFEISIKDLVDLIVKITGFGGSVVWDRSKPDGQPRRMLDITKAEKEFGFKSRTPFEEGLRKTIEWYSARSKI